MISNKIKENNKAISSKGKKTSNINENRKSISVKKTNKIKENHKLISIKEGKKTKSLVELIEIIEQIKKQQNSNTIKIINKEKSQKEKKGLEEVSEVNNKQAFRRWEKDYISLIQNIIYQQLNSSLRFDYDDYIINQENKIFSQISVGFNTPSKEATYYDSPILDNHKVDEIMDKFRFAQMKGLVLGDYFIPENVNPDDFEKFSYFKKLNPSLIVLKYTLNSL